MFILNIGVRKQKAEAAYSSRIPLKVADSATAYFYKPFHILQLCIGFPKLVYFWSDCEQYSVLTICSWNPKYFPSQNCRRNFTRETSVPTATISTKKSAAYN